MKSEAFKRHEEAFFRNCEKWEKVHIGQEVKVPYFALKYTERLQYKVGTVVDKEPPLSLFISIEGKVKRYTVSMIEL